MNSFCLEQVEVAAVPKSSLLKEPTASNPATANYQAFPQSTATMFSSTPPGFRDASFSKGFLLLLGINSIFVGVAKSKTNYDLCLFPNMIPFNQIYRLITSNLCTF